MSALRGRHDDAAMWLARTYRRRGLMLLAATYLLIAVFAVRMLTDRADETVGLLFSIPVALFALALGLRAGLAAAAVALALIVVYDVTHEDDLSLIAYATRGLTFFLLGGLVGAMTTELEIAQEKLELDQRGEVSTASTASASDVTSAPIR